MDDVTITKEPTQTETGIRTYTCKKCHKTRTETIPMLKGHHWDNGTVTKEPTCTEPGEMTYHCTDKTAMNPTQKRSKQLVISIQN